MSSRSDYTNEYNAFGVIIPSPMVDEVLENKNGIDNPVIDLNTTDIAGGTDGQVQVNSNGSLAGLPGAVSNGTTLVLTPSLETVVTLIDGPTPALDASLGNIFTLSATGNRTIAIPTNPTNGQKIVIEHTASGGTRTLSLNTGTGGFAFGSDITTLLATASGKTDVIGCIYNLTANKWYVVAVAQGY